MMPIALNFANNESNCWKDADTVVTKLLNSTSVVNPYPEAETDPVRGPASVTAPWDGEKCEAVEAKDDVVACEAVEYSDAVIPYAKMLP